MRSFTDVASQLGLPGEPRKLTCLSLDWETSLSRTTGKVPIDPHVAFGARRDD
jgi:hypothetical protein